MNSSTIRSGHLVMVDMEGTSLDAATADFLRVHNIRAICLFRKNLGTEAEVRKLCADLRELMGPEALIGIDQEGGSVVRATFLPQPPAAMALGAADDEALAEAIGAAVARSLRGLGINWNFAPVLDINNNPANPVIAERSFGEEPQRVARLAGAWMRGSLAEGVACCVKHFPGHGDTHEDSHHALGSIPSRRQNPRYRVAATSSRSARPAPGRPKPALAPSGGSAAAKPQAWGPAAQALSSATKS